MSNKTACEHYTVIRDTQEKNNYWDFPEGYLCNGTVPAKLKTGDYSLAGLENIFSIERKANTGEFSKNITEKRFERELIRLDAMPQAYLMLEFSWNDIDSFPYNSGIPSRYWGELRVSSGFLRKRLIEIMSDYNIQVILCEDKGRFLAELIFRRMNEVYNVKK